MIGQTLAVVLTVVFVVSGMVVYRACSRQAYINCLLEQIRYLKHEDKMRKEKIQQIRSKLWWLPFKRKIFKELFNPWWAGGVD